MNSSESGKVLEIIARLKSGDQEAFKELYELTHNRVYFLALKLVHSHDNALEVVQETYISVYKSIDKLYKPEVFNAWLSKIVINKCRDHLGKSKEVLLSENKDLENIDPSEAIEDTTADFIPHEVLDMAETRNMIMALIDNLPDAQRTTVLLYYYQGLSVDEIAAIMESPVATVKSRLIYARRQIKTGVEGYESKGVKLYNISVSPMVASLLDTFSKGSVLSPASASQVLTDIQAAVHVAPAVVAHISTGAAKQGFLHKFTALSVGAKIAACAVACAVLATAVVTPIALSVNQKGPSKTAAAISSFEVSIKKTYTATYNDDEYGVWGSAEYNRPVFSGSSPSVTKLNVFYDTLEAQWKMNNEEISKRSMDYFKNDIESGAAPEYLKESPYYDNVNCKINYNKDGILCLVMDQDTFMVGAVHGNSTRTSHTFDMLTGRELFLTDVLNVDQPTAAQIVINAFSVLRGSNPNYIQIDMDIIKQGAGTDTKFYLDEEGIWLYFNEEEVADYATSMVKVCIPYNSTEENKPTNKIISDIPEVKTFYTFKKTNKDNDGNAGGFDILLPEIISSKPGAVALNAKFEKMSEEYVNGTYEEEKGSLEKIYYKTFVFNDVLTITIADSHFGIVNTSSSIYNYDYVNDKVLSIKEMFKKLGLDQKSVLQKIKDTIAKATGLESGYTIGGIFQENLGNIVLVIDFGEDAYQPCYIYDKSKDTFEITNEVNKE